MKCEQQDDCDVAYVRDGERTRLAHNGEDCNLAEVKENCSVYQDKIKNASKP